jgi:hypothetical protein
MRANSLAPYLPIAGSSPIEQAVALATKWGKLTRQNVQHSPQVAALVNGDGGELAEDTVEALGNLLTFASGQFNVGKNLNDVQVAVLAIQLLVTYWYWRFDEFAFVLREAVAGRYGTTYDRIDSPTVNEWCAKYEAERGTIQADQFEHEARAYKQAEQQPVRSELATHPTFGPDYAGVRAQLEALGDAQLKATWQHYQQAQRADNKFIAAVATEVVNERRKAHYLRQVAEGMQQAPTRQPTLREQMASQMQATRDRLNAKLLGEHSPVWGIAQHWLDIIDVDSEPVAPEAPKDQAA